MRINGFWPETPMDTLVMTWLFLLGVVGVSSFPHFGFWGKVSAVVFCAIICFLIFAAGLKPRRENTHLREP